MPATLDANAKIKNKNNFYGASDIAIIQNIEKICRLNVNPRNNRY